MKKLWAVIITLALTLSYAATALADMVIIKPMH